MTRSVSMSRNGWTSFALGLLVAATSVLFSQALWLLFMGADSHGFNFDMLFSAYTVSGLVVFALALVIYASILTLRRKRHLGLDVSVGRSYAWAVALTVALMLVPVLAISLPELGIYFAFALFGASIIHLVTGVPASIAFVTLGIRFHRSGLQTHPEHPSLPEVGPSSTLPGTSR